MSGQSNYSHGASMELLTNILNDPNYTIKRWNPIKKEYDIVCPYTVFRTVVRKIVGDLKYPNRSEADSIQNVSMKISDELVELLPELVQAHLENGIKFKFFTTDSYAVLGRKDVPAGSKVSTVRDMKTGKVDGHVETSWSDHYIVKCSSKRPKHISSKKRVD